MADFNFDPSKLSLFLKLRTRARHFYSFLSTLSSFFLLNFKWFSVRQRRFEIGQHFIMIPLKYIGAGNTAGQGKFYSAQSSCIGYHE